MIEAALNQSNFSLNLRAIYLRSSSVVMADGFDPLRPNQRLYAKFRTYKPAVSVNEIPEGLGIPAKHSCTFVSKFDFRYSLSAPDASGDDNSAMAAEVSATFAIDYIVAKKMPSPRELEVWGRTSAMIHSWPYWREFCHSLISKMNLPVVVMPMLDVQAMLASANQAAEIAGRAEPRLPKPKASKKKKITSSPE